MLTSQVHEIIVLQAVDCLYLATNIELASSVEQVAHCGVLLVASEDFLGFQGPSQFVISKRTDVLRNTKVFLTCPACTHPRQ